MPRLPSPATALLALFALFALFALTAAGRAEERSWRFDFGGGPPGPGFTAVPCEQRFDSAKGYGFDLGAGPFDESDHATGKAFHFSLAVPEGCYRVAVTFGAAAAASDTTVKAESRRLMLESVRTRPGERVTATFTVHVRRPAIPGGGAVRLKEREKNYLHWDDKLTLEFNGPEARVDAIEIRAVTDAPVVHLLGDSTVADQPYEPWNSWGQMLTRFFGPEAAVANHAESGESIRSSLSALRIEKLYRSLKPGDFVLVQFGHNDMKDRAPDALATYRSDLEAIVREVRQRDARPLLITSMERKAGVTKDTLAGYPDAVREVARTLEVPLIDLHAMSRVLYRALGDRLDLAFQDGTHHNNYGSYELAKCVVEGIRAASPELARHLRPEVKPFDPAKPDKPEDFVHPPSPLRDPAKPDGD
jgi:lysophospholipase L1-like esterase